MKGIKFKQIYKALKQSWSIETSSKWTRENPAKGQCGVTALVIHDLCGGEIKKTKVGKAWHFYNRIDGKRYDFTKAQFSKKITYMDVHSNCEEAFADTNEHQYSTLKQKVIYTLNQINF
ncbi:hypothetical protein D0U04_19470 [Bacillus clarus]|uniref:Uncharacterized protein n=1 Tax=Bacillus clarus TaxID=2338372 RepID=A0A090YYS9_9BACI|nr:hypothetical protein [Bacillus clarus]KFN04104.1 hypothetical protein DJ93_4253 [Bacillus clarus]RFT65432.1 hypothetical protein D0U04_19470 [Bacillus clarus]